MANLIRWEPVNDLLTLRDAMDKLFEESRVSPRSFLAPLSEGPALDMYQTKEAVVVTATVPGVKPEDLDVSVTGDTLTIKGEFKEEANIEKEHYFRRERRFGSFSRVVTLPVSVDVDKAAAEFENGVLKLTFPKAESVKAKTISVKPKAE